MFIGWWKLERSRGPGPFSKRVFISRMLKKSARFALAALGGSTYRTEYAFASSLGVAALDGLFDHPAGVLVPSLIS